jgi:hypothetical protein
VPIALAMSKQVTRATVSTNENSIELNDSDEHCQQMKIDLFQSRREHDRFLIESDDLILRLFVFFVSRLFLLWRVVRIITENGRVHNEEKNDREGETSYDWITYRRK